MIFSMRKLKDKNITNLSIHQACLLIIQRVVLTITLLSKQTSYGREGKQMMLVKKTHRTFKYECK